MRCLRPCEGKNLADNTSNEFEFLRGLPFGPYIPGDSPLQRLDPRTRLLLVILFMAAITITKQPVGLVLALAILLLGWQVAKLPLGPLWRGWRSVLPFLLILALFQIIFSVNTNARILLNIGPLAITQENLWAALALILRFSAYIALLGLASSCISEAELTRGLDALLHPLAVIGIPVQDFVLALQITLRFFPLLAQSAERIAKAQAARGADWQPAGWNLIRRIRQIIPMIVPLFVNSLRRSENMALAMDARGYGSQKNRTSMIVLHYQRRDIVVLIGAIITCVFLILI